MFTLYDGFCDVCGIRASLEPVYTQIKGEWQHIFLCSGCKAAHERELAMNRENFQRQFGGE